jgi:hypothetical protein
MEHRAEEFVSGQDAEKNRALHGEIFTRRRRRLDCADCWRAYCHTSVAAYLTAKEFNIILVDFQFNVWDIHFQR